MFGRCRTVICLLPLGIYVIEFFFFSSRRRHTRFDCDWSSDVCSSDLFLKEASMKFRGWIDDLLSSAWESCQGSDILIESPSAMAGIHISEALGIPYFREIGRASCRERV